MKKGPRIPLFQRINLDTETGCWNWKGATYVSGYGTLLYGKRQVSAHRLSAHLWLGMSLDDKRQVMHNCDNRKCFNPKHLKIGTQLENEIDKIARGRHHYAKRDCCKYGHLFTAENTKIGQGNARICLACVKNRNEERTMKNLSLGLNSQGKRWVTGPYKNSRRLP